MTAAAAAAATAAAAAARAATETTTHLLSANKSGPWPSGRVVLSGSALWVPPVPLPGVWCHLRKNCDCDYFQSFVKTINSSSIGWLTLRDYQRLLTGSDYYRRRMANTERRRRKFIG
jgi:hypothetical protein